jgi:hypothetical protein
MHNDFVLQLRSEPGDSRDIFRGRLEHIDSGRSGHFNSFLEFLELLVRLSAETQPPTSPPAI